MTQKNLLSYVFSSIFNLMHQVNRNPRNPKPLKSTRLALGPGSDRISLQKVKISDLRENLK